MKAVLQRVARAGVAIDNKTVTSVGKGFLVLLGVMAGDGVAEAETLADKIARLRVFSDEAGKMNLSVADVGGEVLVVSNFTLAADCRKGNRPSFTGAMEPAGAETLYTGFVRAMSLRLGPDRVASGVFGADMLLDIQNDGPVTILLDTAELAKK